MTRPQTLMVTLLGRHVYPRRPIAVSARTFIEVLDRMDVSEGAARTTLTRMVRRGLLERHRVGRETYFSLTDWTASVLEEGESRIFHSPVRDDHDEWTLLSFSLPESQRSDRHTLRRALSWRGFGRLRNGLWIAPGRTDMADVIEEHGLREHTDVFVASALPPTDVERIVEDCWELDDLSAAYEDFVARWSEGRRPSGTSPLVDQVRLITDWRLLLLNDPGLPPKHLPDSWPAERAFALFRTRHDALSSPAEAEFEQLLRSIDPR